MGDARQIEAAIEALERQRNLLGRQVVDDAVAALRQQLGRLQLSELEAAAHRAERKVATVLFADISGFTALAERLDAEEVRSLVNGCFSLLARAIERHGGIVCKFVGDALMAVFGAPVAQENDAQQALRAALAMQQAMVEFNDSRGMSLTLHFGVNSGPLVCGGLGTDQRQQFDVIGDTVNVAARLEDIARAGEVVVGPRTWRLTQALFDFEALPPLSLQGKAAPVAAYRLIGPRSLPQPARGIAGLRSPLVGREAELQEITETVRRLARSSGGAALSVVADAGLGKSRLLEEARHATQDGARWLEARALAHRQGSTYALAADALDQLTGTSAATPTSQSLAVLREFLGDHLPGRAAELLPFLARFRDLPLDPAGEAVLRDLVPEALQQRMQAAFGEVVCAVASRTPLVLVWEDVHWADAASLELIRALFPLLGQRPLVLLVALRPHEGAAAAWQQAVAGAGRHRTLELAPLAAGPMSSLIDNLLREPQVTQAVRTLLQERSEGNPFFLEEILRGLIDAGVIGLSEGRFAQAQPLEKIEVPHTVQGVIAARIDRLHPEEKRTLQTAAVIGREFNRVLLDPLLEQEGAPPAIEAKLLALGERELIQRRPDGGYVFKHAITREVAYEGLLFERRRRLHGAAARLMETLFSDRLPELAPMLAQHYEAADCAREAGEFYLRAAERAEQLHANAAALQSCQGALRQWERLGDRVRLADAHERMGRVLTLAARIEDAVASYGRALECLDAHDAIARARLHRHTGNAFAVQRRVDEMLAAHDRAVHALGPREATNEAEWIDLQLDRMSACYFAGRTTDLVAILHEARDVIEARGSPEQRSRLASSLVMLDMRDHRYFDLPCQTLRHARNQVSALGDAGNRRLLGRAKTGLAMVHLWRDELDAAESELHAGLALAEAVGDADTKLMNLTYATVLARKRSAVDAVREQARQALELASGAGNLLYRMFALGAVAWVHLREQDRAAAVGPLEQALALDAKIAVNPFRGLVVGPALAVAVAEQAWEKAAQHAAHLLHPSQQRLPSEVQSALEEALGRAGGGDAESTRGAFDAALAAIRQRRLGYV